MNYIIDLKDEINPTTGDFVEREIEKAKEAGYKSLTLIINSFGGSVYEGLSIVSALKNSGMETTAKIEGYCASMAAIIAMTCDKVVMAEHGILMFHNPYLEGREDMSESEKSAMEKTTNSLIMLASRKIDKKTLKKMMDKETWLDATEAFGFGMVDEIYDINKLSDYGLAKEFNEAIVNKNENLLNSIYNKLKTSMENKENTIEEIKNETEIEICITTESDVEALAEKAMGLESEEEIELSIENPTEEVDYKSMYEELLKKFEEMKNSADTIENKLNEMVKKENEFNYNRALERVATAVNEGRIEESSKSEWIETLQNNFDLGVKMLNTIKVSTKAPSLPFNNLAKVNSVKNEWTIRDYEEKDPKALTEILQNNKPLYKQMFYDYYGVEYKG
jgi:ATP-dependent protease ClpP protease subunit